MTLYAIIVLFGGGSGPPDVEAPTRKLLAENGDALFTEGGDNMVYDRG